MLKKILMLGLLAGGVVLASADSAQAVDPYGYTQVIAGNFAYNRPWHGNYYYQNWGVPLALVVPPTAHMETTYSWGVSQNLMRPIYHQYGRGLPGYGGYNRGVRGFQPTPYWPSHTDQFGVHYVRGPWN